MVATSDTPRPRFDAIEFTDEGNRRVLSAAAKKGQLTRLAPGVYTSIIDQDPATVAHRYLWRIVAHEMPHAVIADRSARTGGMPENGRLYVVSRRTRPLTLPGVEVVPRSGPGVQPGDMQLPDGLHISGEARALLDNLARSRQDSKGRSRTLSREEVETWLDSLCATRGPEGLNRLRDQAKALAPVLGRHTELGVLERLIGAALNTRDDIRLTSTALATRAAGAPVDQRRVESFARLADVLANMSPDVVPALPIDEPRRVLLPFYEAYFSNFIEGTEFTLEEAADIVFEERVPAERPQDAHDVLGTYRITNDLAAMRTVPRSSQELLDLSRERHAILMEARPDTLPGRWKERPNRAGETEFVDPDLVVGTLRAGFDLATDLTSPFARAVYMMFVVSEVHPFADGNGRIARLMMNSELVAAGEVRIIIPTVYRLNYLSALKGATHTGNDRALIAALAFARRWTSRVNFASRQEAEGDMARTNALRDARDAEEAGVRLTLP